MMMTENNSGPICLQRNDQFVLGFPTGDSHITRDLRYNPGGVLHTMPYRDLYGKAPPERGIFFRLQVYERGGISLAEEYKRIGKSVIWVCERAQKG